MKDGITPGRLDMLSGTFFAYQTCIAQVACASGYVINFLSPLSAVLCGVLTLLALELGRTSKNKLHIQAGFQNMASGTWASAESYQLRAYRSNHCSLTVTVRFTPIDLNAQLDSGSTLATYWSPEVPPGNMVWLPNLYIHFNPLFGEAFRRIASKTKCSNSKLKWAFDEIGKLCFCSLSW